MFKLNKKAQIIAICGCAVVFAAIILIIILVKNSDNVDSALNIKNYDRVQIKLTQTITETKSGSDDISSSESLDQETEEKSNTVEVCTLEKDNDVIYQDGLSGKSYFYKRDGESYVLYFKTAYGKDENDGKWIEVHADDYNIKPEFNFDVINEIKESQLKKTNDGYVPKKNEKELFLKVLQIVNTQKYNDCEIKFNFVKGKLTQISANYLYNNNYNVEQVYDISYKDKSITVPKPTDDK